MIRINLLPYRTERRKNQILQHLGWFFASLTVVIVTLAFVDIYGNEAMSDLKLEFSVLQAENKELKKNIGKIKDLDNLREDVERKLELVDELQQGRFESLTTLWALSELIPSNVWLSSFNDRAGALSIAGVGESNGAVASFMRALDQSPKFENISLLVISRQELGGVPIRSFSMTLKRLSEMPQDDKK
ncbi:MAG: PilN domain-containing protein [Mariprofundaceae bacterium]|nr:PilN domain-containing protein [Mariprofundaceae bacterium]